jgi:threonine/homoserine/homoserine lactone efflux protein
MNYEIIPALALFAFVSSATPGPNNLMLMASGANYGFRRTIPHMLGISIGFMVLMLLTGIGLVQVFDVYPVSYTILKVMSVAYMLHLAWKIANAAPVKERQVSGTPMTFLQAAAFQWVNPKAWAMALNAITVYVAGGGYFMLMVGAITFACVNLPSVTLWTVLGQQMARFLTNPRRLRAFNWTMAALLIASLYPVLSMSA